MRSTKDQTDVSSAYHPQPDGQGEGLHQSLEQYLRLYWGVQQKEWAFWVALSTYTRTLGRTRLLKSPPLNSF